MNNIYRIEIKGLHPGEKYTFYIGANGDLVKDKAKAVPVSEEVSTMMMERIDREAICYRETA
jgi:hypothetical protein